MGKKQVLKSFGAKEYQSADTKNYEGFSAWKLSDEDALRQLLYCGVTGNTFYVDANTANGILS